MDPLPAALLALVIVLGTAAVLIWNALVRARNDVMNGWSQIDVQLKRRHELVPNLVASVSGYAEHEKELLARITEARSAAQEAGGKSAAERGVAEDLLGMALEGLRVVVEAYPDLKANTNFLALQEELASTENRIGFARQAYNDAVAEYNTKREMFPHRLLAGSFRRAEMFTLRDAPAERAVPDASV